MAVVDSAEASRAPPPAQDRQETASTAGVRAPRLPDALPDRVDRPFTTTHQRDDGASDPAALRPVSMPWEVADGRS
jgi:hypothetical protein